MAFRYRIAVLAAMAALSSAAAEVGLAAEQAGVAAAVRGSVQITERTGAVGRQAASGEPVFLGNAIVTGPDSGMQIILLDETTFTIGANSEIVVDEFVYDPRTSAGKVTATVAKGVFRFVTGKIAKEQPASMQVKLPAGTIGIRGTVAMGRVDQIQQGGATVDRQQVVLVGPGALTEGNKPGGIDLTANGKNATIDRPGYGSTLLGRGGQWGPPQYFDPALIAEFLNALRARGFAAGQQGGPSGNSTDNAGSSTYDSRVAAEDRWAFDRIQVYADFLRAQASQPSRDKRGQFTAANRTTTKSFVLGIGP